MTPLSADFLFAAIALLAVLGVIWFVRETADPAGRDKPGAAKTRRQELVEARNRIRRQLEILRTPVGSSLRNAPPPCREEIAGLEQVLDAIEKELNNSAGNRSLS